MGVSFQILRPSSMRDCRRLVCSSGLTSSQYFSTCTPESMIAFSISGAVSRNFFAWSSVQKPITRSTPARLYQLRSKITISPAAGEVVIFDRSWYNRAGVERVMGFTDEKQVRRFLEIVPMIEHAMIESDIILIKYWLEVSMDEQTRRLEDRINDARKIWKLSPMDVKSYGMWYDYSRARDDMIASTDTAYSPWHMVHSDDKKRARLNIISHILDQIPYETVRDRKSTRLNSSH